MNIKIGTKIKELRKRDNITQERLAEAIGVTNQAISKWEGENGYPDIEYITPIADFFNVIIDYLFDHDTDERRRKMEEYRGIVKKIQNIQDASHHLMNLINDVLGMPKTEEPEQANQIKGFIANMNEMKMPINAIREMASIGASTTDVNEKDCAIHKIQDASNHLLGVINDIMDMSKIKANKLTLSYSKIIIDNIIRRIVDMVNVRVNEKRQNFTSYIASDIPQVLMGDEGRLAQVIVNLLSNAIKFTPEEGSINLDVKLLSEKDDVCTLFVSVNDTGIGISSEQQDKLFDAFEQTESGTGLGLFIAKGIVALMNGNISVKSELGKGSTFSFTVDLARSINE